MACEKDYAVIVAGGGHAGCEAALAASRMGARTLLITMKKSAIGYTSCNPAIGGTGKGQIVKEIDALGGEMAKAADASCIQYRMLNSSKGYAARSSRMQIDRKLYNSYMLGKILSSPGLDVAEDEVTEVIVRSGVCRGVLTASGKEYHAPNVVITAGTFLNGTIHIGLEHFSGGRLGEEPSRGLSANLSSLGFNVGSLKTGTPARLDGGSIDVSGLAKQSGDVPVIPFSFSTERVILPQVPCYMTRTSERTHEIIRSALDRSPLYSGKIRSTGVRYCPSIEDKVVRFPERDSHIVFLEPEGLDTQLVYPNGVSTSLPADVQEKMYRSIRGLENVKIVQPAYGIEYDYVDPTQLGHTLEAKHIEGIFLAGQINGTTGYEEAASLGLIAGINAASKAMGLDKLVLERSRSYIGVLIDDLVTKGTKEPYRMFTSRVEYRILVREDNALERLADKALKLGLCGKEATEKIRKKHEKVKLALDKISSLRTRAGEGHEGFFEAKGIDLGPGSVRLSELLKRPGVSYDDLAGNFTGVEELDYYEKVELEVEIKYAGYIERELARVKKMSSLEQIAIPGNFDYSGVPGLSSEIKEKLERIRPVSLAQASRVSGVTPAAISILMVKLASLKKRAGK